MLDKEWFSAQEIAALGLPAMPDTKRGVQAMADAGRWNRSDWQGRYWRLRTGRGGGLEYHYTLLPAPAQAKLSIDFMHAEEVGQSQAAKAALTRDEMAARFENLPQAQKDKALYRLNAILAVEALCLSGVGRVVARMQVARQMGIAPASISNWEKQVEAVSPPDRKYYLASYYAGRTETVECSPEAWDFIKTVYLRPERPTFQQCYRDLKAVAKTNGWTIPSERTLQRRMDALPEGVRVLMREGQEALKRLYPAQERDRGVFHALEAVNADGHKIDVFVEWTKGVVTRPILAVFQDLYSGLIVSWRVDVSENKETVRLAFGDIVEKYGIPENCWLDNGRAFASKWLSGGTPNRYRFKVKDEDPEGILTTLGVKIHWATPYHGQAKPIERAFRDLASDLAKDIRFAGAYVGNNPLAKPENYGSKAVPRDLFLAVTAERIAEHNARVGRRSKVCDGRSFEQAFAESYASAPIRKATPEQRRLWLLAADAIQAARVDGSMTLLGNRYWAAFLHDHRGQKLVARFDPQQLQQDLHVYRLDGSYLGAAPCVEAVGFNDVTAAREHAANRGAWVKAQKASAKAELKMSLTDAAKLLPQAEEPPPPETKIVRPVFGNTALKLKPMEEEDPQEAVMFEALRQMNRANRGVVHLRPVTDDD
ncbi:MAG TPA: transposase domain-containing protein [Gammaproteobacteria bacterium]|nr:transposase domain-containing protein [Gammaproteobacteria bacterium]